MAFLLASTLATVCSNGLSFSFAVSCNIYIYMCVFVFDVDVCVRNTYFNLLREIYFIIRDFFHAFYISVL